MLDPTTLSSLKVTELKAELKKRGLPVGGLKQALVDRLAEDIIKEQEKQNAPEALEEPAPVEENAQQTNGHATAEVESAVVETSTPDEPVQVQERAKSPTPVVEPEPARAEPEQVQVQAREPSPEVEPAREPSPEPEPVEEQLPPPQAETEQVETEEEEPQQPQQEVVPQAQDSPRPEAVELEVAAEVAEPAQHDVQEQIEHKEPPAEDKEPNPPTEEMQIDAATAKTPEEATPASIEPEKPQEHTTDEDASMSEAPVPTEAPKSLPPTETQSSMAIAEEITAAITSQGDLAVPPATVEPMDTREDSTDLRKRKRRSDSPPPPTDTEDAAAPAEETPAPAPAVEEEEEGSISKKPRQASPPPKPRQRDARFKGLFNNGETLPSAEPDLADDAAKRDSNANGDEDDEPPVKASIHPATRALYIRNLVRPINEPLLRQHLTTLAAGPTGGAEQIEFFFVDAIKSHALIIFASLTAATRVRVGVHGKVWPNERTRKPLWVDFVPEEKVQGWVDTEKKGGRWQVAFNEDESVEGGIRAELEEVGAGGGRPVRGGRGVELLGVPTGPRGDRERKNSVQKSAPISVPVDATTARQARVVDLDELFKSTRTKPKLYYMPVSEEIARERLAGQRRDSRGRH